MNPAVTAAAAAHDYRGRGWSVIPVARATKRPLVAWTEFQTRRASAAEIEKWYGTWPDAGVAVVTGAVSGLVVLDVDPGHGGADTLAMLERDHGTLPSTVEAETGGGGRHLYLRHPGFTLRNRAGLAPGIDVRGDGGMVVAPPSIHPSGRPYRWRRAPGAGDLAGMPEWLITLATDGGVHPGHPLRHWRVLAREGVAEGQRNSTIASFAGHLLWHGVDPEVAEELLMCWNRVRCRPPLDADEVLRTVQSIERLHQRQAARK